MKKLMLTLCLLLTCGMAAAGPNNWRMGVNVGWQNDMWRMDGVVAECQALGVNYVRMDIRNSQTPQHYARVMDRFGAAGIRVLVVLTGDSWSGSKVDSTHYNYHGWSVCHHYAPWDNNTGNQGSGWGTQNVIAYLQAVAPYIDAMKNKWNLMGVEMWNEVTNASTHLCPADYAWMVTEAKVWWPNVTIGTSTEAANYSDYAWQFMQKLTQNTDKVNWYKSTHGGNVPWDVAMHHPYGSGQNNFGDVYNYMADQSAYMKWAQPRPLWFTEIGWVAGNESKQADRLQDAFNAAIDYNLADRTFWFGLYDCIPGFGLIRNQCWYPYGSGYRRPAWSRFQSLLSTK